MIDGIRIVLRLKAEGRMFLVHDPALSANRSIEKIAGIKLHSRFRGPDLHLAA